VNQGTDVKTVQGLLRHSNVTTTLGLYAHRVNASMMAAQDAMMQALETGSQTVQ
jgi:site-specific recombinase XerD